MEIISCGLFDYYYASHVFFLMVDKGYLRIYSQENRRDLAVVSPS